MLMFRVVYHETIVHTVTIKADNLGAAESWADEHTGSDKHPADFTVEADGVGGHCEESQGAELQFVEEEPQE